MDAGEREREHAQTRALAREAYLAYRAQGWVAVAYSLLVLAFLALGIWALLGG